MLVSLLVGLEYGESDRLVSVIDSGQTRSSLRLQRSIKDAGGMETVILLRLRPLGPCIIYNRSG